MAWTYEQLFNALTNGDLTGQDSWSGNTAYDVETTAYYEGGKAVGSTGANANMDRAISSVSAGVMYFAMMRPDTVGDATFKLLTGSSNWFGCTFESLKITISGAGNTVVLNPYVITTWYLFEVTIIDTSHFSVRFNDGSGWSTSTGSLSSENTGAVDKIRFNQGSSGTVYFDTITPTNPLAPSNPPTVDTNATTDITDTTATLNGEITDVGSATPDEEGFVWGTSSQSDPGDVAPASAGYDDYVTDTGSFSAVPFDSAITGLTLSTTYYARAYAHNTYGYTYGSEVSFDTSSAPPFRFTNLAGIEYDPDDTETIFAERLNDILERLEALEG